MADLEQELRALGRGLELPPPPDLAGAVSRRLSADSPRPATRRPLAFALALLAAVLAGALAVPQARTALLELLRIRGATVERVDTVPAADPNARLVPGLRVSFAEAQAAVGFRIVRPVTKDGRPCGALYLDRAVPGGMVSVVCPADGSRRLVLTQFRGAQTPYVGKLAGPDTVAVPVRVGSWRGLWIEGAPHVLTFRDARGAVREHTRRLAGDVLLWERGGVTYRLEGTLGGREQAIRLALDLR